MLNFKSHTKADKLMSVILNYESEKKKFIFSNADGKTWIMPHENMRTAMHLYQPSSRKGKLVKVLFPFLNRVKYVRSQMGATLVKADLEKELKQKLKDIFSSKRIDFAIFGGTPCNHQKITIQLSYGKNILGYCKISDNDEIKKIFKHEQEILNTLRSKQLKWNIPTCLYCGEVKNNIAIFAQSTIKTNHSKTPHKWGKAHWTFLSEFRCKTRQRITFEKTEYYSSLQRIINEPIYLSEEQANVIKEEATSIINIYAEKEVLFSAYHGDLTPWNTFIEDDKLFVFDFEYAKLTYPPHLDWFHFYTQTAIFEKHWSAKRIYDEYSLTKNNLKKHIDSPNFYYKCYLIDIIVRFTNRDKGKYDKDVENCITIWTDLLTRL